MGPVDLQVGTTPARRTTNNPLQGQGRSLGTASQLAKEERMKYEELKQMLVRCNAVASDVNRVCDMFRPNLDVDDDILNLTASLHDALKVARDLKFNQVNLYKAIDCIDVLDANELKGLRDVIDARLIAP